jgi:hypothetical protein
MEETRLESENDSARPSQRSFLLAVITLLATLILSSLCVIALLLSAPQKELAASQTTSITQTPAVQDRETPAQAPPTAAAGEHEPNTDATTTITATPGARRIVDYSNPRTSNARVIIYNQVSRRSLRIITYQEPPVVTLATDLETPKAPLRIINYEVGQ